MAFYDNYLNRLRDALQDSPLVIELKSRYSNLDPKQQQWIAIGSLGLVLFIVLFFPLSLFIATASLESRIRRMEEDTDRLNYAAAEIQELRLAVAQQGQAVDTSVTPETPAKEIAAHYATQANIREDGFAAQDSAQPNAASVALSQVTLPQLRKFLYSLETSPAVVDITQFDVDMKPEGKGYMWSTIAFRKRPAAAKETKPEKKSFSR